MAKNRFVTPIAILIFMTLILLFPSYYMDSARKGLSVFATSVLPALFPFVFLTSILTKTGIVEDVARLFKKPFEKLFGVCPLGAYVSFSSMVCGYPIGAMTLANLYEVGAITQKDVKALLPISSTVGPIFVLGTVGGLLGNEIMGVVVLVSHYVATLINGLLWKQLHKMESARTCERKGALTCSAHSSSRQTESGAMPLCTLQTFPQKDVILSSSIGEAIISSATSMLSVGGYILMGGIVVDTIALIPAMPSLPPELTSVIYGMVEMTRGVITSTLISSSTLKTSIVTLVVTWGGLSVLMQSYHFLSRCNLTFVDVILPKISQGILAFLTAEIFSNLFSNILA